MGEERHYFEFTQDDIMELQNLLNETSHIFEFESALSTNSINNTEKQQPQQQQQQYQIQPQLQRNNNNYKPKRRKTSTDSSFSNSSTNSKVSSLSSLLIPQVQPQQPLYQADSSVDMYLKDPIAVTQQPPLVVDSNIDYTIVKYVISYYLLEENTYGIEKIIISAKHDPIHYNPQQLCSEKQTHYHYIIKFNRLYYENKIKENKPLFPILSEIKVMPIKEASQYNNCMAFITNLKNMRGQQKVQTVPNVLNLMNSSSNSPVSNFSTNSNSSILSKRKNVEDEDDEEVNDEYKQISSVSTLDESASRCEISNRKSNKNDCENEEITLEQLNSLKDRAQRLNNIKLMEEYLSSLERYNKQEETKKTFNEIIEKERPITDYECEVLRYDYDMRMSVFRACHVLDLIDARNQIQSRSDNCPIYVLVGGKSCGKSKIAYHVANTIGKCAFPLVAFTHNDHTALAEWYETGSNVLVFEDFDFSEATDPKEPLRILSNLKKWASGQEIYFVDASKLSKHSSHVLRTRKLKAIFICLNKSDEQTMQFFQSIPENMIEFEFLRFGPEYSYSPEVNQRYLNMYPDSCTICDKSMYKFLKHYQKCKIDASLNNGPKGFRNVRRNLFPPRYPFSIELYTTDYKYAFGV